MAQQESKHFENYMVYIINIQWKYYVSTVVIQELD